MLFDSSCVYIDPKNPFVIGLSKFGLESFMHFSQKKTNIYFIKNTVKVLILLILFSV